MTIRRLVSVIGLITVLLPAIFAPAIFATATEAQQVTAVLSSELAPYAEALAGFRQAWGPERELAVLRLHEQEPGLPPSTRVVVTFGSKAALHPYPDHIVIVQCMSPAVNASPQPESVGRVSVHMVPDADYLVNVIRRLQPSVRNLAVLSIVDLPHGYLTGLRQSGADLGVNIVEVRPRHADELPSRLRSLEETGIDALWLAPDPLLISAQTFAVLKEYARVNRVPFYAPPAGFVAAGAMASVAPSFEQIGAEAAAAARALLIGGDLAPERFPQVAQITLSPVAALRSGLRVEDFEGYVDLLVDPAEGRR